MQRVCRPRMHSGGTTSCRAGPINHIYLLGTNEEGMATNVDDDGVPVTTPMTCMLGGIRYRLSRSIHLNSLSYYDTPLIWRSRRYTISGYSRSAPVRRTADDGFNVVGFQSHQINGMTTGGLGFWKVAFVPPERLKDAYVAICPREILQKMQRIAS